MPARVIFIGLDAMEPDLLQRWAAEGLLPNISRLQAQGSMAAVPVPPGMGNGATWPCFFTGVNPGRHGRYYYQQFDRATYTFFDFNDDTDHRWEPFWVALGAAGRRTAVIDVVKAPLRAFNGIHLANWMAHDRQRPPRSHPPELLAEVTARYGEDPMGGSTDTFGIRSSDDCARVRDQLIERLRTKTVANQDLLARENWDVFLTVFHEPHDLGHQAWHLHDTAHYAHDAKWLRKNGDPIKDLYIELDRCVGTLIEDAGSDATVFLFTGPGMERNYTANHIIDTIVDRLEDAYSGYRPTMPERLRALYHRLIPESLRNRLRLRRRFASETGDARPAISYRKFFAVPHNQNAGAVRFNIAGRDAMGTVQPGAEYDALRKRVMADLLAIVNVDGGEPLIKEIIEVGTYCSGASRDDMPDLLLLWSRSAPIFSVRSELIGRVTGADPSSRTGDHSSNCLVLIDGPGVARQPLPVELRLEDLAPTIAAMVGVELKGIDGVPLPIHGAAKRQQRKRSDSGVTP